MIWQWILLGFLIALAIWLLIGNPLTALFTVIRVFWPGRIVSIRRENVERQEEFQKKRKGKSKVDVKPD